MWCQWQAHYITRHDITLHDITSHWITSDDIWWNCGSWEVFRCDVMANNCTWCSAIGWNVIQCECMWCDVIQFYVMLMFCMWHGYLLHPAGYHRKIGLKIMQRNRQEGNFVPDACVHKITRSTCSSGGQGWLCVMQIMSLVLYLLCKICTQF